MKIFYNHRYGKIETTEIYVSDIFAENVNASEEEELLETGFLCSEENLWYACRSTRVRPYGSSCNFNFTAQLVVDIKPEKYLPLLHQFIKNKKFQTIESDLLFLKRDLVIEYYQDDELIGFSKIRQYPKSIELSLHCHISAEVNFAFQTLLYEIDMFKNVPYIYLGPGYEKSSIYKSKLNNFQWFDGKQWQEDQKLYSSLCKADSDLQLITKS
jgi:hypothetical protein